MTDHFSSVSMPARLKDSETEQGIRDLMGLLALPALWAGRDGQTILQVTVEAAERIVPLRFCYAQVPLLTEKTDFRLLRVDGRNVEESAADNWEEAASSWVAMRNPDGRPFLVDSPLGPLHVVRLSTGYGSHGGSLWFGFDPKVQLGFTQLAFLRTAASLAATGIQTARANHEKELASRAKDEFLAMLGHELRNPLTPIVMSLDLLKRRHEGNPPREVEIIERQAKHLSRLVDDLLDVTRITRGKVELKRRFVNLPEVLVRAIEDTAPLLDQQRHTLINQLDPKDAWVYGDSTRLAQVFSNLLTNAAKYTDPGGLIIVSMRLTDTQVVVQVKDNGVGISPKLHSRLFTIFEQGAATLDRSKGGLGIGLALVKTFVELHGGTVTAVSEGVGQGSEFAVCLPLEQRSSLTESQPDPNGEIPKQAILRRVLLVDDNADALESMRVHLQQRGHSVRAASEPLNALELAAAFSPDVAILDIGLPGMSGYELATELRQRLTPRAPHLIALTGYGQQKDRALSTAAGFDQHLVKPVSLDDLDAAIANAAAAILEQAR